MKFGICLPIRRDSSLEFNLELGFAAEKLGFDSVWVSDHVAVPNSQVGRFSKIFYDPFVLLAAIAAKTEKIILGTSLIILPYRNPIIVAKSISTLDLLSSGRVVFGVGTGWLEDEFNALGVPFNDRGKRTNEYLEIIKNLWVEDSPRFKGSFFDYSDIEFYPKPIQSPYPPIWVGGNSLKAQERAAAYADAWQPTWITPEEMKGSIEFINNYLLENGLKKDAFTFSVRNRIVIGDKGLNEPECYFKGSTRDIIDQVNKYRDIGVSHIVFDPETDSDEETFVMIETISREIISKF